MHAGQLPPEVTDDGDDEDLPCYRHPRTLTALSCVQCERPICTECVIQAPVGIKCPECGLLPRSARGEVPPAAIARGAVAAAGVGSVLGVVLAVVQVPFLGIILAYFAGVATGAAARAASGGFRDPLIARLAAIGAGVGMLAPLVGLALASGTLASLLASPAIVWPLLAAGAAAWGAFSRASS